MTMEETRHIDGWFGEFGGRYVPETLVTALDQLEEATRGEELQRGREPSRQRRHDFTSRPCMSTRRAILLLEIVDGILLVLVWGHLWSLLPVLGLVLCILDFLLGVTHDLLIHGGLGHRGVELQASRLAHLRRRDVERDVGLTLIDAAMLRTT